MQHNSDGRTVLPSDLVKAQSRRFDPILPGDHSTDNDVTTRHQSSALVPMPDSRIGNRKAVVTAPTFRERGGKAGTHAAHLGRENLACDQIGLCVRTEIGHEIEQHEAADDERQPGWPAHRQPTASRGTVPPHSRKSRRSAARCGPPCRRAARRTRCRRSAERRSAPRPRRQWILSEIMSLKLRM